MTVWMNRESPCGGKEKPEKDLGLFYSIISHPWIMDN